jgi:hypothetical protein
MTLTINDENEVLVLEDGTTINDITHALYLVKSHREKYREKHKKRYISKRVPKDDNSEIIPKRPRGRPRKILPVEN